MFGFRNRKKYNGVVDVKLNNEYGIKTQNNPYFPGIIKYLELIDVSWNHDCTEDECALQIGILYLCGLIRLGRSEESNLLAGKMDQIGKFGVERGLIREEIWKKCVTLAENAAREVNPTFSETKNLESRAPISDVEWASIAGRLAGTLWEVALSAPKMLINPNTRVVLAEGLHVTIFADKRDPAEILGPNDISFVFLQEDPRSFAEWVNALKTAESLVTANCDRGVCRETGPTA